MSDRTDVLQGTLALMILKTLHALGAQHGYGIARRIEQVSHDALRLNQGTLYPALVKLEQQGWIRSKWGVSENNRKAKFYTITPRGERQLAAEEEKWARVAAVVGRFLAAPSEEQP
jgi:transcriptional regulator